MADETRNDSRESQQDRPKRITLEGRRFGYITVPAEYAAKESERPEQSARRNTGERRRAS
jgi:hypothetical protein